jgi:hypothetical protein
MNNQYDKVIVGDEIKKEKEISLYRQERTVMVSVAAVRNDFLFAERIVIIISSLKISSLLEPYLLDQEYLPCSVGFITTDGKLNFCEEEHDFMQIEIARLMSENVRISTICSPNLKKNMYIVRFSVLQDINLLITFVGSTHSKLNAVRFANFKDTQTVIYCSFVDNETEANLFVNQLRELCATIPKVDQEEIRLEFESFQMF